MPRSGCLALHGVNPNSKKKKKKKIPTVAEHEKLIRIQTITIIRKA